MENWDCDRRFGGMSVHTRPARRHIPEEGILHSYRRKNLKSYNWDCAIIQVSHTSTDVVIKGVEPSHIAASVN
jgi:hypothetical protein